MKAYVLHGVGDLRYGNWPIPEIQPGWALVRVLAAGVCSSDIPRIFEKGTYHFPTIPGHEFCGIVEKVADRTDEEWLGKRVGVFPLIPCQKCLSCKKEQYETCENYDYIGSRRDGAFAEYVAVPVWNLLALPDSISDVQAALLEPAAVALHAVRHLGELDGKSVCVVGTGAIGIIAAQWAKILGAQCVTVKGRNEGKKQVVKQCGMEFTTEVNREFDCVIEAVGSVQAWRDSIALIGVSGKIVLIGNPTGNMNLPQNIYWKILRKQITLTGTWNSSFGNETSDWVKVLQVVQAGILKVDPIITRILNQDELIQGLDTIRNSNEINCRTVIRFS